MIPIRGPEERCVVVGVTEKNGVHIHHPLNLEGLKELLVVDLDYFLHHQPLVRDLVQEALTQKEENESELRNERDALKEKLSTLRKLALERRPLDVHICPEDILAITGEKG